MATDFRDYFNTRVSQELERNAQLGLSEKYDALQAASRQKAVDLNTIAKQRELVEAKQRESWVGQLGLDPYNTPGQAVNLGASLFSGVSRFVGEAASLLPAAAGLADESSLTEDEIAAYNRKQQNIATPEDMALLTKKKAFYAERDTPEAKARAQELADRNPQGLTALDLIERSQKARTISRNINQAFDASGVVNSAKRDELVGSLGDDFQAAWDQTGLANMFKDDKEVGSAKDVVAGVAKLLVNAGDAAINNPAAAAEYITENLPQLVVGGTLKGGKLLLSASNAGYAADNYQQGMAKYAAENNGAFPPPEERQKMALYAASTALAEQVGELGQLAAIGKVRKSLDGVDPARLGFKQSLLNTGKATAAGTAEESVTEGYQTFAEGEAQRKPASAKDIYVGGVIGGIAGGGLSGGGRAVAESLGVTPEKTKVRNEAVDEAKVFADALSTGDVSAFTDKTKPTYSLEKAISALSGHSRQEGVTEEAKAASFEKAGQLLTGLQDERDNVQTSLDLLTVDGLKKTLAQYETLPPSADRDAAIADLQAEIDTWDATKDRSKEAKQLQKQLAGLDAQIASSEATVQNFYQENQPKELDIAAEVATVNGTDATASKSSADRIINLSMAIPERVDASVATELADNPNNALTTPQRAYLRAFSAARVAEVKLKDLGKVSMDILEGGKNFVGIQQYRSNVAAALATGNRKGADQQLEQLGNFIEDHKAKADMVKKAYATYQADSQARPLQVVSDGNRGWSIQPKTLTNKEREEQGAVFIEGNSVKLVKAIPSEVAALENAQAELKAAYDLKFTPSTQTKSEVNNVKDVQDSQRTTENTEATAEAQTTAEEGATTESGDARVDAVESDVQRSEDTGVTEEPPASAVSTANTVQAESTAGQLQSTEEGTTAEAETQTEATEVASEVTAEITDGKLKVISETSEEGTAYNKKKFGDFFTQVAGKETDGSQRPLVLVKNFMEQWANKTIKLSDYLKDKSGLTDEKRAALKMFADRATAWSSTITGNLRPSTNPDYNYADPIRYLIDVETKDLEQNLKTAIVAAGFAFISDEAGKPGFSTLQAINSLLGRDKDAYVNEETRNEFRQAVTYQHIVIESLGTRVMDAIGFKADENTPVDLVARLRNSLGAHALKMLEDQGVLVRKTVDGKKMARMRESVETDEDLKNPDQAVFDQTFFSLARNAEGGLTGQAAVVATALRGSKNIIQNLFGIEAGVKLPSLTPIKGVQKTSDTGMETPALYQKVQKQDQSKNGWKANQNILTVLSAFLKEEALELMGVTEITDANTHVSNKESKKAKNDGLIREYDLFTEFVGEYLATSEAGLNQEFFLAYEMWKQQRVGIATSAVNPQGSKVVRWLIAADAWNTTIKIDGDLMDSFKLRVGEGLGLKPERALDQVSLDQVDKLMAADTVFSKGAKAVQASIYSEAELSEEQKQDIKAAVKAGKQKLHTLAALTAWAHYQQALDTGATEFTTNLMGEVDGVSNGSILNHVLYGAANSPAELAALLQRGGIFTQDSNLTQYNEYRGTPGHQDIYEDTGAKLFEKMRDQLGESGAVITAIWNTVSSLVIDENGTTETPWSSESSTFTKNGRDMAKGALNPLNYGAGLKSVTNTMAGNYVDGIMAQFEKFSVDGVAQAELDRFVGAINVVLKQGGGKAMPVGKPIQFYMATPISNAQSAALMRVHKDTVGKAVADVVSENFTPLLDRTRLLVQATNTAFELYAAVKEAARKEFIKELGIPLTKAGNPVHGLSAKQEKELDARLESIRPVMHSAMSAEEGNLNVGLLMARTDKLRVNRPEYMTQVNFGKPLTTGDSSLRVNGQAVQQTAPGVVAISASTQALDSYIAINARDGMHILNTHDAGGAGIGLLASMAENQNRNTFQALLNYSPLDEAQAAMMRVIKGIVAMNEAGTLPKGALPSMVKALEMIGKKVSKNTPAAAAVDTIAVTLFSNAVEANKLKLTSMSQWSFVDQYAFSGGHYEVTDKDRQSVVDLLNSLPTSMSAEDKAALDAFGSLVFKSEPSKAAEAKPATTVFGDIGTPSINSDASLVAFFKANPSASAEQVIGLLASKGKLNGINKKILQLVGRTLRAANPNLTVRFVTPETAPDSLLATPQNKARGWYVATVDGKTEIYVLSPEFKNSGLTSELLLHEMVHAAISHIIANPSPESAPLIAELEALRAEAQKVVNGLSEQDKAAFAPALVNLDEFVAWGMTNQAFQAKVLTQFKMPSTTRGNVLVTGMKKFISALTGLLFKKPDAAIDNGLEVLISNVSGLFYEAGSQKTKPVVATNLSMETAEEAIGSYTTLDIHEALNTGAVSARFQEHLGNLLGNMVDKLHGPFGAFAASMRKSEAGTPEAIWQKALYTGVAPFASAVMANLPVSAQEAFAIEQIEATVKAALLDNEALTKTAYKELADVYDQAEKVLKPSDFASQEHYDFVFKVEAGQGGKSDYLARFAALALGSESFNALLDKASERRIQGPKAQETLIQKIQRVFANILTWASNEITKTYEGQPLNSKVKTLVGQLVDIEAKKRETLKRKATQTDYFAPVEDVVKGAMDAGRAKVAQLAKTPVIRDNANGFISGTGALIRVVADDQVEWFMKGMADLRDSEFKGRLGVGAGLLNNFKGIEQFLLDLNLLAKKREKDRQDLATTHAKMALKTFSSAIEWTKESKASITQAFMRTGLHNVMAQYTFTEMDSLLDAGALLDKEIADHIQKLDPRMRAQYIEQAKGLGYYKATGLNRIKVLMMNAHVISKMANTQYANQITPAQATSAEAVLKSLVSLYALKYTPKEARMAAQQVLRTEMARTDGGNGVEFVLKMHQNMEKESLARIFKGNPMLMEHGYVPEILNPHTAFKVADAEEGALLVAQGYSAGAKVVQDLADPQSGAKQLFIQKDGGLMPWLSGILSLSSKQAKGASQYSGKSLDAQNARASVLNAKLATLDNVDTNRDLTLDMRNNMAPTYNENGEIVDWRYLMSHQAKDELLERDNSFDKVLGMLSGSVFDKQTSIENNARAIKSLREAYNLDYEQRKEYYVEVGDRSTDPEMKELWNMLPYETKQEIRKVWGRDGMKVHNEALDAVFGYRKLSVADFLRKEPKALEGVAKVMRNMFTTYARSRGLEGEAADNLAKRYGLALVKGERGWQEIVHEVKDIIVIRTFTVMRDNILSNFSFLYLKGVPLKDMAYHHMVAWKGAWAYRQDHEKLQELQANIDIGYTQGKEQEMRREVIKLQDRIARNPVTKLIEAGLMPTIVEDVANNDDPFSYKTLLARSAEKYTSKLNPAIRSAGEQLYMSPKSQAHKALSYVTQMSDFMARYTLYQHQTTTQKTPLSHEDAIRAASEAFVNYDIPMHRTVQYFDDMGLAPFVKYFINMQRVLLKTTRENPARLLSMLALNNFMDLGPIVLDGSFVHHMGNNPFDWGALKFPGILDEIATIKLLK